MAQKNLHKTSKLLTNTEGELRKCQYTLKEKDFVISEQRKAGMHDFFFFKIFKLYFFCIALLF